MYFNSPLGRQEVKILLLLQMYQERVHKIISKTVCLKLRQIQAEKSTEVAREVKKRCFRKQLMLKAVKKINYKHLIEVAAVVWSSRADIYFFFFFPFYFILTYF